MGGSHRILIVGRGGREHALAWRLGRDPDIERVMVSPGNDGIARSFTCFPVPESDAPALIALAHAERVTLAVIGPETPLALGLADALVSAGVPTFGPSRAAAQLESSKWTAKEVMEEARVPSARARAFESLPASLAALGDWGPPWVLKADGLAAGKGVRVTEARAEAEDFLRGCLEQGRFGPAGRRVVIEEFLRGEEVSIMAVCDGVRTLVLPSARDYKRAFDRDRGLNTGGMGAYAPSTALSPALESEIERTVVRPVVEAMARRGTPYRGTLYAGLMLTEEGPKVVEFNCRFGDPESQVVLPLMEGSLAGLLASAAAGRLDRAAVTRGSGSAVSVAVVDEGYPDTPRGGGSLAGLDALMERDDLLVFHAGTKRDESGWRVQGGRALHLAARAASREEARARVYAALESLGGQGWRYRSDIARAREVEGSAPARLGSTHAAARREADGWTC